MPEEILFFLFQLSESIRVSFQASEHAGGLIHLAQCLLERLNKPEDVRNLFVIKIEIFELGRGRVITDCSHEQLECDRVGNTGGIKSSTNCAGKVRLRLLARCLRRWSFLPL